MLSTSLSGSFGFAFTHRKGVCCAKPLYHRKKIRRFFCSILNRYARHGATTHTAHNYTWSVCGCPTGTRGSLLSQLRAVFIPTHPTGVGRGRAHSTAHAPPPTTSLHKSPKKARASQGRKRPLAFLCLSCRWRFPPCSSVRFPFRKRGATANRPNGSFAVCGAKSPHVFFFFIAPNPPPFPRGERGRQEAFSGEKGG